MNQCVPVPAQHSHLTSGEKPECLSVESAGENLLPRISPQSDLLLYEKESGDEMHRLCQSLQRANMELEGQLKHTQKELESERKRTEIGKERFIDLAKNHRAIIFFMKEYKQHNVQLRVENKELQLENKTLFSKTVQEKEVMIQKLLEENKQLRELYTNKENEYLEKITITQSKALEQAREHQTKEASLLDRLESAQKQLSDAVRMCEELELKLQKTEGENAVKEANLRENVKVLTKENGRLLHLTVERMQIMQENDKEIQKLGKKWKQEKEARIKAEERFKAEAEVVQVDAKVMSLQAALHESTMKYVTFQKEFEAFREHVSKLLMQERELNKTLRHLAI